jgi:hypothetical protein
VPSHYWVPNKLIGGGDVCNPTHGIRRAVFARSSSKFVTEAAKGTPDASHQRARGCNRVTLACRRLLNNLPPRPDPGTASPGLPPGTNAAPSWELTCCSSTLHSSSCTSCLFLYSATIFLTRRFEGLGLAGERQYGVDALIIDQSLEPGSNHRESRVLGTVAFEASHPLKPDATRVSRQQPGSTLPAEGRAAHPRPRQDYPLMTEIQSPNPSHSSLDSSSIIVPMFWFTSTALFPVAFKVGMPSSSRMMNPSSSRR